MPWQRTYLAIFAAFLGTVGESFMIDTDHWRHFWMMLGCDVGHVRRRPALQGERRDPALRASPVLGRLPEAAGHFSTSNVKPGVIDQPLDQLVPIAAPGVQMPAGTSGVSRSRQIAHSEIIFEVEP